MIKYICKKPGPKSVKIIERDHKVISQSLTREYSFVFKRAQGCYVYDVDGRKYLDFAAGVAVANIGHTNKEVMQAICAQTKESAHCGFSDFYAELPVKFVETLISFMPYESLQQVYLSNSGTESVEAAYKLARWHTKKLWTIAFKPCFHGRTMGSLSLTNSQPVQRERFEPFLPVKHINYPYNYRCTAHDNEEDCGNSSLDQSEIEIKKLKENVASIFLEPVSGEGGYIVPPKNFVRGLRELCDKYNILLVA